MKRILCIALCVMMVASLFAGCSGPQDESTPAPSTKHTHQWGDAYERNETSHWKQCADCGLKANTGAHVDQDMDGKCDDCGYEEACEHTFNEEIWKTDAENHWHPATCKHSGQKGSLAAHVDENNDGICEVCEYFDAEHTHTYEEAWTSDANEHWHAADCGHTVVADKAAHEDANNDGKCDECAYEDPNHTHTFDNTQWETDAGNHWHGATCEHTGAMEDWARHSDEDVNGYCDVCNYLMCTHCDYDVNGICDICGYVDPDHTHTYVDMWVSNHSGHWKTAECHPGATTQLEAHVDVNKDGICDTCAFVICSHTYKSSWSSDDTHHWKMVTCTCSIPRKDYGKHVDEDGVPGCDICMHGYQAPAPFEKVMDNEVVTMTLTGMITWQEVTLNIEKPGRYLISSDNTQVRWYQNQGDQVTSYATEMYFEEAGEVTVLAYHFNLDWDKIDPFEIHVTMLYLDDLVLDTSRGKAELPTNMVYTIVFEAMAVGEWVLQTSVPNLSMGTSVDSMGLTQSVEVNVAEAGDEVVLYVLMQDDTNASSFVFDWELVEPFQLNVTEGMSPISVPAVGDDYKVVFTAPADGRYLLSVTSEYLSFSEWGLGGFSAPVRTESTQQLTPEMKAGETFTTWIQPVYDYPQSTNVNDTLTIINVGTILNLGASLTVDEKTLGVDDLFRVRFYTAREAGTLNLSVVNGKIGVKTVDGEIQWLETEEVDGQQVCNFSKEMQAAEVLEYYIRILDVTKDVTYTTECNGAVQEGTLTLADLIQDATTYTADAYGIYDLTIINGLIGLEDAQGQIQWLSAQELEALDGEMQIGESVRYYVLPVDESQAVTRTFSFQRWSKVTPEGKIYSFTADETSYYNISVVSGEIGITINGVTQWVAAKDVDGQMVSSFEVRVEEGETFVFQIRSQDAAVIAEVNPVAYVIDMTNMYNGDATTPEEMGKDYTVNMVPSKEYDLIVPDGHAWQSDMLNLKVKLTWDYKGVFVTLNGEPYKQGTEISLRDVQSLTARLQNNVNKDVKFTLEVTYAPVKEDYPTTGELTPDEGMLMLQVLGNGQTATATFTASVGGTYTLKCDTMGAVVMIRDAEGNLTSSVLVGQGMYTFQVDAGQTVEFVIDSTNGDPLVVSLSLLSGGESAE